jgi:deaminated glutathione amidase
VTYVAAIQMASGPLLSANLLEAARHIRAAAEAGARLVVLPENFAQMGMSEQDKLKIKEDVGHGRIQSFLAEQAQLHRIWLVGGTLPITSHEENKVFAATMVYNSDGACVAYYNKIHLFDVHIHENGEVYQESATITPGDRVVVVDTPCGKLGLAICYDLRFPELFRTLCASGAEVIAMPAAFTAITGKAHWEPLVRARAIENQVYMIASAQGGYHANGRETHGDSMIVTPWGVIADRLPRGSGIVVADIDLNRVRDIRKSFPVLEHMRISCKLPAGSSETTPAPAHDCPPSQS